MIRNVKIKKFQVKLAIETKGTKLIHENFEMVYVKGVLLRTAWRDAILKLQKDGKLPKESKMEQYQTFSLEITPTELLVDLIESKAEKEESEKLRKERKKPTKEEMAKFRKELEADVSLGEEEESDDSENDEDEDDEDEDDDAEDNDD